MSTTNEARPMDKDRAKALMEKARKALEEIDPAFSVKFGRGSFDERTLRFRVEFHAGSVAATRADDQRKEFEAYCSLIDLKPEALGKSFPYQGRTFSIVGMNLRARKQPVVCEREDGKRFKFPVEVIRLLLPDVAVSR